MSHSDETYQRLLGIFYPNLLVSSRYPEGNVVYKEGITIYRDVNSFLANLEKQTKQNPGAQPYLVARYCFQGSAKQWFFDQASYLQDYLTQELDTLCKVLYQKFDPQEQEKLKVLRAKEHKAVVQQQQPKPVKNIVTSMPRSETAEPASNAVPAVTAERTLIAPIAVLTPPATPPPPSEPALVLTPPVTSSGTPPKTSLPDTPPTSPVATPRKPISWAEIASRPVVAPKPSRLPIPTPKIAPNISETTPNTRKPIPRHQISYLTIDDLYEMFAGKPKRMGLLHTKRGPCFPCVSHQAKITSYFRPAPNQKAPISQGSKTSKPKSFHQRMPAESIRTKSLPIESLPPTEITSEKSRVLPYKLPFISDGIPFTPALYKGHAFNRGPNCCNQWTKSQQISQSETPHMEFDSKAGRIYAGHYVGRHPPKISLMALIRTFNLHTCRRCFRVFRFNNDLHGHLRCTHLEHRHRRFAERTPRGQRLDQLWRKV